MNSWRDDLYANVLMHDGKPGMHWGVRKYRNYDGTLTPAGRERYGVGPARGDAVRNVAKKLSRKERKVQKEIQRKASAKAAEKAAKKATKEAKEAQEALKKAQEEAAKKKAAEDAEPATPEGNAKRKLESDLARMKNDELRAKIDKIKLEREYKSLVNPQQQNKTKLDKALSFVDQLKKINAAINDGYKIYTDIKKAFSGESEVDKLRKIGDKDKLLYDLEVRDEWRKSKGLGTRNDKYTAIKKP